MIYSSKPTFNSINFLNTTMKHARDVLNEIKWRSGLELAETVVYYQDRVRPELGFIEGFRIKSWDKSFIYTDTGSAIPFHRVEKIIHGDEELYMKRKDG